MGNKGFEKEYLAIAYGIFENTSGTINLPIARKPGSIMERYISSEGNPSITNYEVIEYLKNATYLKLHPITGRTHQIRVHCHAVGHPLVGDFLYLPSSDFDYSAFPEQVILRHALHSSKLSFIHPLKNKRITLNAKLPNDFAEALEILRK
jgi:23S rRNA pseudouridine1911/1915/1917 synthase